MTNWKEKVVIVAGGTGGIGSATSKLLASLGAAVVVVNRRNSHGGSFMLELQEQRAASMSFEADLRDPKSWKKLVSAVTGKFGRTDVLVNCIGILVPGTIESLEPAQVQDIIDTNILSIVNGVRAVAPVMRHQEGGHIVNVGSLGGIVPMPFESLYSATKFAVRGLSLSLDEELKADDVRVTVISCGPVRTAMLDREAYDPDSTTAFLNTPLNAHQVASAVREAVEHPVAEVVIPRRAGRLARLSGLFPNVYRKINPLLRLIGKIRQQNYMRKRLATGEPMFSGVYNGKTR